jgi:hypothetical protein
MVHVKQDPKVTTRKRKIPGQPNAYVTNILLKERNDVFKSAIEQVPSKDVVHDLKQDGQTG